MKLEYVNAAAKYIIALTVILGCFYLIATSVPLPSGAAADNTQPWSIITLIVGWLIRDSAGNSATANAVRTINAVAPANGGA